jgi:hypothetical protein
MRGDRRWIYLNAGSFNGLFEAGRNGGALPLPIHLNRPAVSDDEVLSIFAGSSCDGDDVLGEERAFPADIRAGDAVTIANAGAYSLSYVTPLCGLNPLVAVAHTEVRCADLGDGYRVHRIVQDDRQMAECVDLESTVFEAAGFLGSDGTLGEFREYDDQSVFVLLEHHGDPIACLREIVHGPREFKTLKDFEISPSADRWLRAVGREHLAEVGTVATVPTARGVIAAQYCYAVAWTGAVARGTTHWVASIDSTLLGYFRNEYGFDFVDLGPEIDYFGSPTTPVVLELLPALLTVGANHTGMKAILANAPLLDAEPSPRWLVQEGPIS